MAVLAFGLKPLFAVLSAALPAPSAFLALDFAEAVAASRRGSSTGGVSISTCEGFSARPSRVKKKKKKKMPASRRWRRPDEKQRAAPGSLEAPGPFLEESWQRGIRRGTLGWRASAQLTDAYLAQLAAGAVHVRSFFPAVWTGRLLGECLSRATAPWSEHEVSLHRGDWTLAAVEALARAFEVDVLETRVNVYRRGLDHFKPQHQDRNAHDDAAGNVTVGASFGAPRSLEFVGMAPLEARFTFRQNSGDVFAFDSTVNAAFTHGVPRGADSREDRLSVVVWGWRDPARPLGEAVSRAAFLSALLEDSDERALSPVAGPEA